MKALKIMLAAVAFAAIACLPAAAQFRIGPRIGTEVNSMRLNSSLFDNDNRAGFTGGVQVEFTVPVINLGFDASVMYVHRVSNSAQKTATLLTRPASASATISRFPSTSSTNSAFPW